jgi:FSR family fosmidomycin resistance protein-like MFS transporter
LRSVQPFSQGIDAPGPPFLSSASSLKGGKASLRPRAPYRFDQRIVEAREEFEVSVQSGDLQETSHAPLARRQGEKTVFSVLLAISFCHLLNDMMQSLVPALYPILKSSFSLNFSEVGLITFTFQITASLLQPLVGLYTDHRPKPYLLACGMGVTLTGLALVALASSYLMLLVACALVGFGSAIFHPESSRVARAASGGRYGLAQSVFQVGGNSGQAIGPLMAAFIVIPHGQISVAWFCAAALLGMLILANIGTWSRRRAVAAATRRAPPRVEQQHTRRTVFISIAILSALTFSKAFYLASINSYLQFYLIDKFQVSVPTAQTYLFLFLGAIAIGTFGGGPISDRFDRKHVIWFSILGVFPFTMLLPYADLYWTGVLLVLIGLILASTFSMILVYAQELVPGKVGLVAGLFFGAAFGLGGLGAAVLGVLADMTSIGFVYSICAYLPAIGLLAAFLPSQRGRWR